MYEMTVSLSKINNFHHQNLCPMAYSAVIYSPAASIMQAFMNNAQQTFFV